MLQFILRILSCLLLLFLIGCNGTSPTKAEISPEKAEKPLLKAEILNTSYATADSLIESAKTKLRPERPLIVATFVNSDDLKRTSSFGRVISEQVASRFTQRGFNVLEVLLRNHSMTIRQRGGKFLLSGEVQHLSQEYDAQAAIVGTYVVGRSEVYVTVRLIRTADSIVLASHDYTLPIDHNVAFMLRR